MEHQFYDATPAYIAELCAAIVTVQNMVNGGRTDGKCDIDVLLTSHLYTMRDLVTLYQACTRIVFRCEALNDFEIRMSEPYRKVYAFFNVYYNQLYRQLLQRAQCIDIAASMHVFRDVLWSQVCQSLREEKDKNAKGTTHTMLSLAQDHVNMFNWFTSRAAAALKK